MGLFDLFRKGTSLKQNDKNVSISFSMPSSKDIEQQASIDAEKIARMNAACRKSEHGLSVSQILLLEYCKKGKYPNPEGGYPRFWYYDYGLKNVGEELKKLAEEGFIRFSSPKEILSTIKVDQLKEILHRLNLPANGKKAELVERIKGNADDEFLKHYVNSDKYILTEFGEKELEENEYISYLHSHKYPEISIWDVNKNSNLKHWRDYIWGRFNKCSIEYASKGQWGLYRNVRFSMAEFLFDEAKYLDAFAMYGEVCFYDVNGADVYIDYDDPADLLIEGILTRMKKAVKEGNISDEKQREILLKRVESCQPVKRRVQQGKMTELILCKMQKQN